MTQTNGTHQGHLKLYTNHGCPYAHRAHIVIKELDLQYDEEIIDLDVPRPDWYLKINPRGTVPALIYTPPSGEPQTILESALIVNFLIDAFPERSAKLLPPPSAGSAYQRYRAALFADLVGAKLNPLWYKALFSIGTDDLESKTDEYYDAVVEWILPLLKEDLKDGPYLFGSDHFTLAEVLTAPFFIRPYAFASTDNKALPKSLKEKLDKLEPFNTWLQKVITHPSVTYIWNEGEQVDRLMARLDKMKVKYGQAAK